MKFSNKAELYVDLIYCLTMKDASITLQKQLFLINSVYTYIFYFFIFLGLSFYLNELTVLTVLILLSPLFYFFFMSKIIFNNLFREFEQLKLDAKNMIGLSISHDKFSKLFKRDYFFMNIDNEIILDIYLNIEPYLKTLEYVNKLELNSKNDFSFIDELNKIYLENVKKYKKEEK